MKKYIYLIVILGFSVYFISLFNGFVWDDFEQITANTVIRSIGNVGKFFSGGTFSRGNSSQLYGLYYRPVVPTLFASIYSVFGGEPFFFHLVQVIIHIGNATLIFYLFKTFTKPVVALFASLIFLIHPVNVEAVAYISGISDILFVTFGLSALLVAVDAKSIKSFFLMGTFLLLSLFSKETGIIFLVLSLFASWLFNKKAVFPVLETNVGALLLYGIFRFKVAKIALFSEGIAPIMKASLLERIYTAPSVLLYYLKVIFYPKNLAISQHWVITSPSLINLYVPLFLVTVFFAGLTYLGWLIYQQKNNNFKLFIFFMVWFLFGLAIHIHIIHPLDMTAGDRWTYFPLIGLLGMAIVFFRQFEFKFNEQVKRLAYVGLIILLGVLSLRTIFRTLDWKTNMSISKHDINISKDSFELENLYGTALMASGNYTEAQGHLEKSVKLVPYGINLNNLATLYLARGDKNKAIELFRLATDFHYYKAYENLASMTLLYGSSDESAQVSLRALKIYPLNTKLWYIFALSEYKLGKKEGALLAAEKYSKIVGTGSRTLYDLILNNVSIENILTKQD